MASVGKCYFCQKNKSLIKAHIIPKSFFRGLSLFDDRSDLFYYDENQPIPIKRPKGIYDKAILCCLCEKKLEVYDNFGYTFLSKTIAEKRAQDSQRIKCTYEQYIKLKKFFISILWKSSVSNREEFGRIKLDSNTTSLARNYLLGNIKDDFNGNYIQN